MLPKLLRSYIPIILFEFRNVKPSKAKDSDNMKYKNEAKRVEWSQDCREKHSKNRKRRRRSQQQTTPFTLHFQWWRNGNSKPINRPSYQWVVRTGLLRLSACPLQSSPDSRPCPWSTSRKPSEEIAESGIQTCWWRSTLNSPPLISSRTKTMQHPVNPTIQECHLQGEGRKKPLKILPHCGKIVDIHNVPSRQRSRAVSCWATRRLSNLRSQRSS